MASRRQLALLLAGLGIASLTLMYGLMIQVNKQDPISVTPAPNVIQTAHHRANRSLNNSHSYSDVWVEEQQKQAEGSFKQPSSHSQGSEEEIFWGPSSGSLRIVVLSFGDSTQLSALLNQLSSADYGADTVWVDIHILDGSQVGAAEVAQSWDFPFGTKHVKQSDQSSHFELWREAVEMDEEDGVIGRIILPEYVEVSFHFYTWANEAILEYGESDKVAGLSLESPKVDVIHQKVLPAMELNRPFLYVNPGSLAYVFSEHQRQLFAEWLTNNKKSPSIEMLSDVSWFSDIDELERIKSWTVWVAAFSESTNRNTVYPNFKSGDLVSPCHSFMSKNLDPVTRTLTETTVGRTTLADKDIKRDFPIPMAMKRLGWDGVKLPTCSGNTCLNGGRCQLTSYGAGVKCICPKSYSGMYCNNKQLPSSQNAIAIAVTSADCSTKYLGSVLRSLLAADYLGDTVPLYILLNGVEEGNKDNMAAALDLAERWDWAIGTKTVIPATSQMYNDFELWKNALNVQLEPQVSGLLIIDDHVQLSSEFYKWFRNAVGTYGSSSNIAGVALENVAIDAVRFQPLVVPSDNEPYLYVNPGSQPSMILREHLSGLMASLTQQASPHYIESLSKVSWYKDLQQSSSADHDPSLWLSGYCAENALYFLHPNLPDQLVFVQGDFPLSPWSPSEGRRHIVSRLAGKADWGAIARQNSFRRRDSTSLPERKLITIDWNGLPPSWCRMLPDACMHPFQCINTHRGPACSCDDSDTTCLKSLAEKFPDSDVLPGLAKKPRESDIHLFPRDIQMVDDIADHDGVVVVVTASAGFVDFLENWYIFAKSMGVTNVLVIAEDLKAYYVASGIFPDGHVMLSAEEDDDTASQPASHSSDGGDGFSYNSKGYNLLVGRRPHYLINLLKAGHTILYADVDAVWLHNPFDYEPLNNQEFDLVIQADAEYPSSVCEIGRMKDCKLCTGFMLLRPTEIMIKVVGLWDASMKESGRGTINQVKFNKFLEDYHSSVNVHVLDYRKFPSGNWYWDSNWRHKHQDVYVAHNNFIVGPDRKRNRFKDLGLWKVSSK